MTDHTVPVCCIEDCSENSSYTDVKYWGILYENLCETHFQEVRDFRCDPTRPKCIVPDCDKLAHCADTKSDGTRRYRKVCYQHHQKRWYRNRPKGNSVSLDAFTEKERTHYGDLLPFYK